MKRIFLCTMMLFCMSTTFAGTTPHMLAESHMKPPCSFVGQKEERRSIFCSNVQKDDRTSRPRRYRGVGGLVCMIFDGLGISYWHALGILILIIILKILVANSKTDHDWRWHGNQDEDVFDVGETKDDFFKCIHCQTQHRRKDATRIILHGNRRTVQPTHGDGEPIIVESNIICRVPMCVACENALYKKACLMNVICRMLYIGVFAVVVGWSYCLLRFTIASSMFFGLVSVVVVGIVRIVLHYSWPRRFSISFEHYFTCIPQIAALCTHGFQIGKSHADIVDRISFADS